MSAEWGICQTVFYGPQVDLLNLSNNPVTVGTNVTVTIRTFQNLKEILALESNPI